MWLVAPRDKQGWGGPHGAQGPGALLRPSLTTPAPAGAGRGRGESGGPGFPGAPEGLLVLDRRVRGTERATPPSPVLEPNPRVMLSGGGALGGD